MLGRTWEEWAWAVAVATAAAMLLSWAGAGWLGVVSVWASVVLIVGALFSPVPGPPDAP